MTPERIREIARRIYGANDMALEIDPDAEIWPATEGGCWVAAHVYVSNETLDAMDGVLRAEEAEEDFPTKRG